LLYTTTDAAATTTTTTTNTNSAPAPAVVQKLSVIISFQKYHYCSGKQSKNICICDLFGIFMPIDMQIIQGPQFV
jgi:hypothetical protein